MDNSIIRFDGTLSDWAFVLILCAAYVAGKYVSRPKSINKFSRRETLNILIGLSIYKNMTPAKYKKKQIEALSVKVSEEL